MLRSMWSDTRTEQQTAPLKPSPKRQVCLSRSTLHTPGLVSSKQLLRGLWGRRDWGARGTDSPLPGMQWPLTACPKSSSKRWLIGSLSLKMLCPKEEKRRVGHGLVCVQVEIYLGSKGASPHWFLLNSIGCQGLFWSSCTHPSSGSQHPVEVPLSLYKEKSNSPEEPYWQFYTRFRCKRNIRAPASLKNKDTCFNDIHVQVRGSFTGMSPTEKQL